MRFFETKWPAILLWPFAQLYRFITGLRNFSYSFGILRTHRLDIPVISIGNITIGGTGKTPTVIFLAQWLQRRGKKVCVLSRGYGRQGAGTVIVSDGVSVQAHWSQAGDEPVLMANRLPGAAVVVDADRVRGGRVAQSLFKPDVILLDDGMQHRRLHRNIDIVTFRRHAPLGNGFLLPAGPLRESTRRLQQCHLFWSNGNGESDLTFNRTIPRIRAQYKMLDVVDRLGRVQALPAAGTAVIGFCGIAHPLSFEASLQSLGLRIDKMIAYPDHYVYQSRDVDYLSSFTDRILLTTEKDWIKLGGFDRIHERWRCLRVHLVPEDPAETEQTLQRVLQPVL
jgi:tetraacyldisaccharide 4'-kinase